jgi:hypothetical protein
MRVSQRDPALDIIRALCILSMVIGHLAFDSPLYWLTHSQRWVNGAVGFVLLAGLVIGMVQRRQQRTGTAMAVLARRARLVWLAQVVLVLLALLLAPWNRVGEPATPPVDQIGGLVPVLWQTLTMRINPVDVDILSLYIVLFAVAAVGVLLLRAGRPRLLLALSFIAYAVGLANVSGGRLPRYDGVFAHFNIATWQLLFVLALVVGWYWRDPQVARFVADRRVTLIAAGVLGGLFLAAQHVTTGEEGTELVGTIFGNGALGPGRILLGWCLFLVLYRLLHSMAAAPLSRALGAGIGPIGRRSLDAFVILTVFDLALAATGGYPSEGLVGMGWAAAALVVAWVWATYRDHWSGRRTIVVQSSPALPVPVG